MPIRYTEAKKTTIKAWYDDCTGCQQLPAHEHHAENMANSNTATPWEGKVRTSISEAQIDLIIFELKQSGLLKQAKDLNITEPNFYTALKLAITKGLSFDERKRRRPAGVGL